jgi:hypothetical protein
MDGIQQSITPSDLDFRLATARAPAVHIRHAFYLSARVMYGALRTCCRSPLRHTQAAAVNAITADERSSTHSEEVKRCVS